MIPNDTIASFDEYLAEHGLRLDAVVIGGAALALLGIITRPTCDCDILHPDLPPDIIDAAKSFAAMMSEEGETLDADWLNNGPSSLVRLLPDGWLDHVQQVF